VQEFCCRDPGRCRRLWAVADENVDCDLEAGIAWQFYRNTYLDAQPRRDEPV